VVDLKTIGDRIISLKKILSYCEEKYFLYNQSPIADQDYDLLLQELKNLQESILTDPQYIVNNKSDAINPHEPQFSSLMVESKKAKHNKPMLSLQKVYEIKDLMDFFEKSQRNLLLEMKIDGISISLIYQKGLLIEALTRGDGEIGEKILAHVLEIKDIPLMIKLQEKHPLYNDIKEKTIEIRGELYIKKSIHGTYFPNNIHPRNICAGLIRRKYPDKTTGYINFFAYSIFGIDTLQTQEEVLQLMQEMKLPVEPNYLLITEKSQWEKALKNTENFINTLDYECDGIVLKINNLLLQESMGYTNRHPRGTLAFKFANKRKSTFLTSIEWQVGTNGTITPVGNINPIQIDNVLIQKVTLHNYAFVKKLTSVNIIVERAGGVIPKAIQIPAEISEKMNNIKNEFLEFIPEECPSCKNLLIKTEKDLICTNYLYCTHQKLGRLIKFCQKFNLYGIGKKQMQILLNLRIVSSYCDICTLPKRQSVTPHPKISQLIWDKFLQQVSEIPRDYCLLSGITISYGGNKTMEKIANILAEKQEILNYSATELTQYFIANSYFTPKIASIIGESIAIFSQDIQQLLNWIKIEREKR
jgi:DNA ligase (NAD+)